MEEAYEKAFIDLQQEAILLISHYCMELLYKK